MSSTWHATDPYGDAMSPVDGARDGDAAIALNAVVEFDSPFKVEHHDADGQTYVTDHVPGVYAPEVVNVPHPGDVHVYDDKWTALTGHTGQYGYNGAVMHPSETLSGGLARRILSEPGTYVVTEVRDDDGQYPDGDPIGWAVLRLND